MDEMLILTFSDASWGSRGDGSSQGGFLILATEKKVLLGQRAPYSILNYGPKKLKRVCRSPLAAETQALSISLGDSEVIRLLCAEFMCADAVVLADVDAVLFTIPSAVITDCKPLWDGIERQESAGLKMDDRRRGIECLECREGIRRTNLTFQVGWQ